MDQARQTRKSKAKLPGIVDAIQHAADKVGADDAHQQAARHQPAPKKMPRRRVGTTLPIMLNQAGVTMPPPNAAVAIPMKKSSSANARRLNGE